MRLVVVLSLKIRLASGVSCIVVISCRIMPISESGDQAARALTRLCQIRIFQFTLPRHQPLTYIMKMFKWLTTLFAAGAVAAHESGKAPPTELQIETTFMPEVRGVEAKNGDHIKVHYVSLQRNTLSGLQCHSYFPLDWNFVYERQQV